MGRIGSLVGLLEYLCVLMLGGGPAWAASQPPAEKKVVVATVGGEPVYRSEVDRLLDKVTGGKEVNPAALPLLRARLLAEIVDRRLVLAYARRTKSGASPAKIDAALAGLESKLASQGRSLDDYLEQQSITLADLRRQITWNLTWEKYLARYVTEKRLASYFQSHRREFDGTQVSVSHILLRPEGDAGAAALDDLVQRAEAIRQAITSGKLSFAEAARKHSDGPSAAGGGRLGFIARHGAMVEAFSRAAFQLEVGQVSPPVRTQFGVHLIRCDEIKPGSRPLADIRNQLEEALGRELIDKLARLQRQYTPVQIGVGL